MRINASGQGLSLSGNASLGGRVNVAVALQAPVASVMAQSGMTLSYGGGRLGRLTAGRLGGVIGAVQSGLGGIANLGGLAGLGGLTSGLSGLTSLTNLASIAGVGNIAGLVQQAGLGGLANLTSLSSLANMAGIPDLNTLASGLGLSDVQGLITAAANGTLTDLVKDAAMGPLGDLMSSAGLGDLSQLASIGNLGDLAGLEKLATLAGFDDLRALASRGSNLVDAINQIGGIVALERLAGFDEGAINKMGGLQGLAEMAGVAELDSAGALNELVGMRTDEEFLKLVEQYGENAASLIDDDKVRIDGFEVLHHGNVPSPKLTVTLVGDVTGEGFTTFDRLGDAHLILHTTGGGGGGPADTANNALHLGGYEPSYYLDMANATGLVPTGRLSGSYNINITGNANTATTATFAVNAGRATVANTADLATLATFATAAESANTAAFAANATSAVFANTAGYTQTANTANYAGRLNTPRVFTLTGAVTGNVSFDGSSNVVINTTLSSNGSMLNANNATYLNGMAASYYLNWNNFNNTPTTLSGYGITDAVNATDLDAYLPLTGGTTTGEVKVSVPTGQSWFRVNASPGNVAAIGLQKGNLDRWSIRASTAAETGSNAGSNLNLQRHNDDGSVNGNVLTFDRATGVGNFEFQPTVQGNVVYHAGNLLGANTTVAGLLSATDKAKLDGIANNATALTLGTTASTAAAGNHTHTFASLTAKPTTLAGYGITDAVGTSTLANYLPLSGGTLSGALNITTATGANRFLNIANTAGTQWRLGSGTDNNLLLTHYDAANTALSVLVFNYADKALTVRSQTNFTSRPTVNNSEVWDAGNLVDPMRHSERSSMTNLFAWHKNTSINLNERCDWSLSKTCIRVTSAGESRTFNVGPLKQNTKYSIFFRAKVIGATSYTMNVDLFPDTLPERIFTITDTVQEFSWDGLSSAHADMLSANVLLRFFRAGIAGGIVIEVSDIVLVEAAAAPKEYPAFGLAELGAYNTFNAPQVIHTGGNISGTNYHNDSIDLSIASFHPRIAFVDRTTTAHNSMLAWGGTGTGGIFQLRTDDGVANTYATVAMEINTVQNTLKVGPSTIKFNAGGVIDFTATPTVNGVAIGGPAPDLSAYVAKADINRGLLMSPGPVVADLDAITGEYFAHTQSISTTNGRPTNHWHQIISAFRNNDNGTQLAMNVQGDGLSYRRKNNGTWHAWKSVALEGNSVAFDQVSSNGFNMDASVAERRYGWTLAGGGVYWYGTNTRVGLWDNITSTNVIQWNTSNKLLSIGTGTGVNIELNAPTRVNSALTSSDSITGMGLVAETGSGGYTVVEWKKTGIGREWVLYTQPRTSATVGGDIVLQGRQNDGTEWQVFTGFRQSRSLKFHCNTNFEGQPYFETNRIVFGGSGSEGFVYSNGTMWLENNRNFAIGTGVMFASRMELSSNGPGNNIKIGDDCWIGDAHVADGFRVAGVGNVNRGAIQFGASGPVVANAGDKMFVGGAPILDLRNNVWLSDQAGINRFYWANSDGGGHSFYGSAANHEWRTASDATVMTLTSAGQLLTSGDIYQGPGTWFRVRGNNCGIHWENYGGGWYMNDTTWLRVYNNKSVVTTGAIQGGTVTGTSDERLKTSIGNINNAGRLIDRMKIRRFKWKSNNRESIGFFAQELQLILPEAVHEGGNGYLTVEHLPVLAATVQALQETRAELESTKDRVAALEKQVQQLLEMMSKQ